VAFRSILSLVKQGVPWDEAVKWSATRRMAANVILGELDGGSFDFKALEWRART
jgi:hypothetical protein